MLFKKFLALRYICSAWDNDGRSPQFSAYGSIHTSTSGTSSASLWLRGTTPSNSALQQRMKKGCLLLQTVSHQRAFLAQIFLICWLVGVKPLPVASQAQREPSLHSLSWLSCALTAGAAGAMCVGWKEGAQGLVPAGRHHQHTSPSQASTHHLCWTCSRPSRALCPPSLPCSHQRAFPSYASGRLNHSLPTERADAEISLSFLSFPQSTQSKPDK